MQQVWVEITGRTGTVAGGRDVAPGEVVCVHPAEARKLMAAGSARMTNAPSEAPQTADLRKRTR